MAPIRSRRAIISEKEIEDYLVERVRVLGGDAPKLDVNTRRGRLDRLVVFPGRRDGSPRAWAFYVEVKREGQRLRPEQHREAERLRALGFEVRVVWSYGDVDDLLRPYESH